VSTDNPKIMFIFLIYSQVLCWGNVSNSNVTVKFAQLYYFLSHNVGREKRYYVPPCPKVGETCLPCPPLNSFLVSYPQQNNGFFKIGSAFEMHQIAK